MNSGIYIIENLINKKIYVGQSNNIKKRWRQHKNLLKANNHHNIHLQRAWNKYGEKNFSFHIMEFCEHQTLLNSIEILYISYFDSYNNGYNQTKGGEAGIPGYHHREESKKAMSQKKIGKLNPAYGKRGSQHPASKCNSSGVVRVYKCPAGWCYYYTQQNGKQKRLYSKDPQKLKARVLQAGLIWDVKDEKVAKQNNLF